MKAVQLIGYGDAVENLEVRDVPEPPQPAPGEVLVGVEYAPINFNDLMVPWGVFPLRPNPPATIGNEGAGVVLALGKGVTSVAVGDRVVLPPLLASVPTYQQRLNVPASDVVVVPPDADPQQASMMGINPVSAELLLNEYVALKAGDAVVFNSATSGLSHWLIALAKERGVKTIGLVRKVSDVVTVTDRGCDFVIVDDEPLDEVAKKLEGLNIPLGLDVLGGPSTGRVAQILTPGGKLVVSRHHRQTPDGGSLLPELPRPLCKDERSPQQAGQTPRSQRPDPAGCRGISARSRQGRSRSCGHRYQGPLAL
jgi:NADPH:quinone reductase-like Zn-dependent oxidoreductase